MILQYVTATFAPPTGVTRRIARRGRDAPIYDAAIQFLEQNRDRPFYMNVWGHISHHRVDPPKKYVDLFQDLVVDEAKFAPPMQAKFANCKARGGDVSEHMRAYLADIIRSMKTSAGCSRVSTNWA